MTCISLTCNSPESSSGDQRFLSEVAEDRCSSLSSSSMSSIGKNGDGKIVNIKEGHGMGSIFLEKVLPLRALYAILVTELWRDPVESLQIIALWLWLERVGFGKVTRKILASAQLFLNQTAEEAIMCLKCIKDSHFIYSAEAADIPMTRSIIEKEISLRFFNENRVTASCEVVRIINQDCLHTMRDITAKALHGNAGESSSRKQMMVPLNANAAESSSINQIRIPSLSNPIVMPSNGRRRLGSNEMMVSRHFDDSEIRDLSNMRIGRNAFTAHNG